MWMGNMVQPSLHGGKPQLHFHTGAASADRCSRSFSMAQALANTNQCRSFDVPVVWVGMTPVDVMSL